METKTIQPAAPEAPATGPAFTMTVPSSVPAAKTAPLSGTVPAPETAPAVTPGTVTASIQSSMFVPVTAADREKFSSQKTMISMKDIVKRFYIGQPNELQILNGINLEVKEGEFVAIVGESGSGKSTLMNIIGVLDRPTEGSYMLDGVDVGALHDRELSTIRNQKIGFVFQTFNLIPRTNALKNVELPMLYAGTPLMERSRRAKELLAQVGMQERMNHQPNELSGGQKQRIAIARAMATNPAIILADEPTGALDSKTGRLVMDIFHELHEKQGKTIVLITHSKELAMETQRIVTILDGRIISEERRVTPWQS